MKLVSVGFIEGKNKNGGGCEIVVECFDAKIKHNKQ